MPPDGTRRSARIPKQIAISLVGSDIEGRVFSEQTKTVLLSRHGAGIISAYKLSAEQEIVIRSEESKKEIEARVVGQIGSDGATYIYGVAFLDPQINFWGIDFPDLSETERQAAKTLLECSSCHAREMADHSDLASDVMAVNQSIVRYCQKCGSSTLWKQPAPSAEGPDLSAGADVPAGPGSSSAEERPSAFAGPAWMQTETRGPTATLEPVTARASAADVATAEPPTAAASAASLAAKGQENRRKHARTRVNFKACVRRPGLPDDVVACEDMSRGGLRFKSSKQYFETTLIDVAVPYSPGGQAIFVPAQIRYVQELPEQKMYRCGVMYLRSGR
ncbi:MAG TPA: PilZ domain-containing protein [Candidatus Acidoferrum sp.]|nr:PilZ domain-containing protein [Candidatus Acidoferrum sp.]